MNSKAAYETWMAIPLIMMLLVLIATVIREFKGKK